MTHSRTNRLLPEHERDNSDRGGVTLVEVLMSLMIMSIGVASVAVLFPISVLRSIQATQLTNGAVVKYRVESLLDVRPDLVFDPDGDGNLVEHVRQAVNRNYIIDPIGFYTHLEDGSAGTAGVFGNDGTATNGSIGRWGGLLTLTNGKNIANTALGAFTPAERQALRMLAQKTASQGDAWETQIDAEPGALVAGGVQLSSDLDLTQVPTSQLVLPGDGSGGYLIEDPENYRIVLFSDDGSFSQAFPLVAINTTSNTAYFTEDVDNDGSLDSGEDVNMNGFLDVRGFPREFRVDLDMDGDLEATEVVISRVLLQSRKVADFSWMLNVRRRSDGYARRVDVVVRFNDGVDFADERLFEATFIPGTSNVWVRLPSRVLAGDTTEPKIRKGKYVFDAVNGMWYRIEDVLEAPLFPSGNFLNFDYLLRVDKQIRPTDGSGSMAAAGPFGWAMFPSGIVDVYSLGSRTVPRSLQSSAF